MPNDKLIAPMPVIAAVLALALLLLAVAKPCAASAKPTLGVGVFSAGSDQRPITAPGQPFSFQISLDNMNGAADANHVILSALLPRGAKFQRAEPPPAKIEGARVIWEMDRLPAKALPRLFRVTAQTESNLAPGSRLEISAAAESSEGNENPDRNHASLTLYVQEVGPDLVMGSNLDSIPLSTDGPATFKVDVMNAGNLTASDVRLKLTLAKQIKFDKANPQPESVSGQMVSFKLGDLARAESRSVTMTIELDPLQLSDLLQSGEALTFSFEVSRIASRAEVTDSHFEITKHIEAAGQNVALWLTVEGAKEPGEVSPRDDVTCVITYANLGNQPAHKAVVTLNLGTGLAMTRSDPRPSSTAASNAYPGGVAHWDIGDLDIGQSGSIRSVVHVESVDDDGALVNASITADGIDTDTSNNTASLLWHRPLSAAAVKAAAFHPTGRALAKTHHHLRHLFELILVVGIGWMVVRTFRRA